MSLNYTLRDIKVYINIRMCIHFKSKILWLNLKIILNIQYGSNLAQIHQAEFTRYISKIFHEESVVFIIY